MAGWQLSVSDVARLFGVTRQAVQQWLEDGVPAARQPKLLQILRIGDLLERNLQPSADPGGRALRRRCLRRAVDARADRRRPARRAPRVGRALLRLGEHRVAVRFRHVARSGRFVRVAHPDWRRPLDPSFAAARGGRWNPPGSFPVLYLCATRAVARAVVLGRFEGLPYGLLDLRPDRRPVLIETDVPLHRAVDVVTEAGCRAVDAPRQLPLRRTGPEDRMGTNPTPRRGPRGRRGNGRSPAAARRSRRAETARSWPGSFENEPTASPSPPGVPSTTGSEGIHSESGKRCLEPVGSGYGAQR